MSFQEKSSNIRPASGEAPLHLNEVFYSRTDSSGVIQFGNNVFHRVAHYSAEELLGAPHNIIRHPDMPKGVFWLFWDTLKRGRSIGAYVKNKSNDGLYYWVYTLAVPCGDGYLSASIKPSSPVFTTIQAKYAELLRAEQDEDLSPQDSAARLLEKLQDMGFDTYHGFATQALFEELSSRGSGTDRGNDLAIQALQSKLDSAKKLVQETNSLVQEFEAMRTIPHNLRVIASRIEPAGGPVTVLSQNYGTMSRDMSDWFERNVLGEESNFAAIKGTVNHGMFIDGMVRILMECDELLKKEQQQVASSGLESERRILENLIEEQRKYARSGLKNVDSEAGRILNACNVMHRHFLGLSSTRVLCKIESARLPTEGEALTAIIDQLGVFQGRISEQLERIASLGAMIQAKEG